MKLRDNNRGPERVFVTLSIRFARFFPYFFIFYVVTLIVGAFSRKWHTIVNWPTLHISMALFAFGAVASRKGRAVLTEAVNARLLGSAFRSLWLKADVLGRPHSVRIAKSIHPIKRRAFVLVINSFRAATLFVFSSFLVPLARLIFTRNGRKVVVNAVHENCPLRVMLFGFISCGIGLYALVNPAWNVNFIDASLIIYAVVSVVFLAIDERITATLGIASIVATAITNTISSEIGYADLFAQLAFWFLTICVATGLHRLIHSRDLT